MRTVFRLVYTYFTATPVWRALTLGGIALWLLALYILTTQAQSAEKLWLGIVGIAGIFVGGALMPLMVGNLARSHAMTILPYGRLKLLVSAFVTVLLVALPVGVLTPLSFGAGVSATDTHWWSDPRMYEFTMQLGRLAFASSIIIAGWLYLALWFITSQRNAAGFVKGMAVVAVIIFVRVGAMDGLTPEFSSQVLQIVVAWSVFGAGFLALPRLREFFAGWSFGGLVRIGGQVRPRIDGREIDFLLGTASPWIYILAQSAPIILATRFGLYNASVWLFFVTIFSTVAGAVAGQAAQRSRVLWLRADWSRAELFLQVERSFWRHNGFVLGAILLMMLAIGGYAGLPARLLAAGLPLLVLGTVLSTYLGLMVTRGLRWVEAGVGVFVMLGLMTLAIVIVEQGNNLALVFVAEVLLAGLAFVLREVARRRWSRIDWMECRAERAHAARGTT